MLDVGLNGPLEATGIAMDIDGVVIAMDIEGAAAKSGKLSVGDFVMAIDDVSLHDKETAEIQRLCKSTGSANRPTTSAQSGP